MIKTCILGLQGIEDNMIMTWVGKRNFVEPTPLFKHFELSNDPKIPTQESLTEKFKL